MFMNHWKNEKAIDVFSDEEPYDSDRIDSDVEAELYSVIHHETDNSTINFDGSCHSLDSSNKENTSISSHEEFNTSNITFEKSSQIAIKNHNNNSPCFEKSNQNVINNNDNLHTVKIIESADKFSVDDKISNCDLYTSFESPDKINIPGSFKDSPFKRKSDSDCTVLDDSSHYFKKQKKDTESASKFNNNEVNIKSIKTVVLTSSFDDSDNSSDNDIICIEPSDKQKHFETNVSQIIETDSDSNTTDSWCFTSSKYKTSTPSNAKSKDLWFVNDDDLMRSRRSSSRYHESQFMTCSRCNQKGHSSKFCSFSKDIKCFICGGNHGSFRCKNKICAKCFRSGHDMIHCPREIYVCEMCHMPGHHHELCPDLWRRFQRTTKKKSKKIWRFYQDTPFFCYNCGLTGHFGAVCKRGRMNVPCFPTWPFVLNYRSHNKTKVKPMKNALSEDSSIAHAQVQTPNRKRRKKKLKKNSPNAVGLQQISFPRTPKNSQSKPHNEEHSVDRDSKLKEKLLKHQARKLRRRENKQKRKEMLLQRKATAQENIN